MRVSDIPAGLSLRPARVDDALAIAALITAVDVADGVEPWVTEHDVREDLEGPDIHLETDTWLLEGDGEIAGYGELWNVREEEGAALNAVCWTAPGYRGRGIGSFLVNRTEEAAGQAAQHLPQRPLLIRNFVEGSSDRARALLQSRGYHCVRHFFHMVIGLDDVATPPPMSDGLSLRSFDPDRDIRDVHRLIEDAFQDHWNFTPVSFDSFQHRVNTEHFDAELTSLVCADDQVVGVAFNGTKLGMGWVEDLAVRKDMRGRGIGELLLQHTFGLFKAKGWSRVGLGVDTANASGALRLYERVGMTVMRRLDAYEKEIVR
jgi:mycothiol synthase